MGSTTLTGPSGTGNIVFGTGNPLSMIAMHHQPEPAIEAARRAKRFDCRLVETRGCHSDAEDSKDEDDEDCSNRSTDGISSSASSSASSFDGLSITDRNLDRKNYAHRLPMAAPPSPNMIDAEDELDQYDAGQGYDKVRLPGTNATLERPGCCGSSTWSGGRTLFGLHQLRNDSYETATLQQKPSGLGVPESADVMTRVTAGKGDGSLSETMQNDSTMSLPRLDIRRSSTPPCNVSSSNFHHSHPPATVAKSVRRPPPLDFESLKEKLEVLMTSGHAVDSDKKLGLSPMNLKSAAISRHLSKDGCHHVSSASHSAAVSSSSASAADRVVNGTIPDSHVSTTIETVPIATTSTQCSVQPSIANEASQPLTPSVTTLQSPVPPPLSSSTKLPERPGLGVLQALTSPSGGQESWPGSFAQYSGETDDLCDVVKHVIKTSPVARMLIDYVTMQALQYDFGLKRLQQRHLNQLEELQQKHRQELTQLSLGLAATQPPSGYVDEHVRTISQSCIPAPSLATCQQMTQAAAAAAVGQVSLSFPSVGGTSMSVNRSFSLPNPVFPMSIYGSPSTAVPFPIGPVQVPTDRVVAHVGCSTKHSTSVVKVTEAQTRCSNHGSAPPCVCKATTCCCTSPADLHSAEDSCDSNCRSTTSACKQNTSLTPRDQVRDGSSLKRLRISDRRFSLCNDVTSSWIKHRPADVSPSSKDHVTNSSAHNDQVCAYRRQSVSSCLESSSLLQAKSLDLRRRDDQCIASASQRRDAASVQNHQLQQHVTPAMNSPTVAHRYVTDQSAHHYHQQLTQHQPQLNYLYGSGMAASAPTVGTSQSQLIESAALLLQQQQQQREHQQQLQHYHQLTAALQQEQQLRILLQQQQMQQQANAFGFVQFQPYFPVVPNNFAYCFNQHL